LEGLKKANETTTKKLNDNSVNPNIGLDDFVYSVSQNLRAPLASVKGLLSIAKDHKKWNIPELDQLLGLMESSVYNLDTTLREILDYSRNARLEVVPESIDIQALVNECFDDLEYVDDVSGIDKVVIAPNAIPFYTDKYRLSVIFNGILSNAVHGRDRNKEKTTITVEAAVTNRYLNLKFEDNGVGIKEEYLPQVCDIYYRAHEQGKGAGLGLYVVREVVEKLKGWIHITSVEGKGTTVSILLPNLKPEK
jgi:signal transduction histidine kinase